MELKCGLTRLVPPSEVWLLIELYGIEISLSRALRLGCILLLIELYGIEIDFWCARGNSRFACNRTIWNWNLWTSIVQISSPYLLIELYGIEIANRQPHTRAHTPFNRTIWNWNLIQVDVLNYLKQTFNRTIWNWNCQRLPERCPNCLLLIELYGIEILLSFTQTAKRLTFNRTIWNWNTMSY